MQSAGRSFKRNYFRNLHKKEFYPTAIRCFSIRESDRYSSVMTLTKVLPKPIESGDEKLARKFADFLKHGKHFTMIQISERIAEAATRLGQIIRGNRCVTVETAIKIGRHFLPMSRYQKIASQHRRRFLTLPFNFSNITE
jgi:hypothetical protein